MPSLQGLTRAVARLGRPTPASSRTWRGPPGHEYSGKTQQYQRERNRAPPVLPEGSKTMVALTPDPEEPEKQENDADNLANPTHSPKIIPADVLARVAADYGRTSGWAAALASRDSTSTPAADRSLPKRPQPWVPNVILVPGRCPCRRPSHNLPSARRMVQPHAYTCLGLPLPARAG